jgi:DNA-binding transcriptional ArsR family regulator
VATSYSALANSEVTHASECSDAKRRWTLIVTCDGRIRTCDLTNPSEYPNVDAVVLILIAEESPMVLMEGLRAIASPTRLRVLELLRDPERFPGPRDANGRAYGVTAKALLSKITLTQPSLSEQMGILIGVGLVEARHVGRHVVYTRDEERIRQLRQTIIEQLLPA